MNRRSITSIPLLWIVPVWAALALAACATNPATGQRQFSLMSEAQEIQIGREADVEIRREMGVYDDPELQRYVNAIGQRLAKASERPELPWSFAVIDEPAVNAFALPGGFIYLTRGILAFLHDEDELAGVLGHEIGHVTARHSAQQYTEHTTAGVGLALLGIFVPEARPFQGAAEAATGLLLLKYGRDHERQADRLGVQYSAETGFDPAGVAGMLNTLARLDDAAGSRRGIPNWLSTHPAPADRVAEVQAFVKEAHAGPVGAKPAGTTGASRLAAYQKRIDGLVFGDSPRQGFVRGNRFLHPELRFAVTFPAQWQVQNSPQQVLAQPEGQQNMAMVLQLVSKATGSVEQVARTSMANAGFQHLNGQREPLNGLDAYIGVYQGAMQGIGNAGVHAAHIVHGGTVYILAGLAPAGQFNAVQSQFDTAVRSFRPLSAAEAEKLRPSRIDLYTVRSGDTWESLAKRSGEEEVRASTLAIMNNSDPARPPRVGDRIKIVVQ
jgi:predicted Zn-dependent protease